MTMHHPKLAELVRRDPRYAYEAYEFTFAALAHTLQRLGRAAPDESGPDCHVSGPQLLDGARDLALQEFGLLARAVFHRWGIDRTDDFGEIVFNLVDAGLMSKTDADRRQDFHNVYDLDQALVQDYQIRLEGTE